MLKTIQRIIQWAGPYRKNVYWGFLCSFFTMFCTAAPIMLAAACLDWVIRDYQGIGQIPPNAVLLSLAALAALVLLRYFFSYWHARLQESFGYEVAAEQRIQIGDMLKRVPLGYFSQNSTSDILSGVTTELSTLELQGVKMLDTVVSGYIGVLVTLLFLFFACWQAALVGLLGVALSALALWQINRRSDRSAPITHGAEERMTGSILEYVRGLAIVKSFGQEGVSIQRLRDACRESKGIHLRIEGNFVPLNCLHQLALKLASVGMILAAGWLTVSGAMPASVLLVAILFSFVVFNSVESVNDAAHILGVIASAMDKLENLEKASYIDADGKDIALESYDVSFDHVSFGYGAREVLHDVSFTIPAHTTTAVVGPSGSGKSTLCSLIARFYDVNQGTVRVGGHDVRTFTCDSLLRNISMVFQNVYLFHDSIRNNICFGAPDATEEQMIAAAKAACCHDFITALPDGYDTVVGEGGSSLSGGEKQRVSTARAILKDAPIVILDEATASIDPENEHLIQQALSALTHGKTIVTIAHRLATIEHADQILVMEDGRITQRGTHKQLLAQEGLYRRFVEIRERAEGWRIG